MTSSTILLSITLIALPVAASAETSSIDSTAADAYAKDIQTLASDEMEGRGLGTKGIDRAAAWIEQRLRDIGLEPAFDSSYRQPFEVKTGVSIEKGNSIEGITEDAWIPLGFSGSGKFSGEMVFVGYGIEAEPLGYQELDGIDLEGKVALVLRYEPQERDDDSPFAGRQPSRWSALRYKVHQLRERGATAVVFTTGPIQDEGTDRIPALRNDGPQSPAGIPAIQVKTSVAQEWLSRAGIDLEAWQAQVDRDLRPGSRSLDGIVLRGRVALEATYSHTSNVVGVIPGKGELASEVVVIGAHYDHLGYGGRSSMRPNEEAIHNGADDNASGTIAVLHAAERLKAALESSDNHRTLYIALFSAEEVGLAGSAHLVDEPPFEIDNVVAMVNLDMVGRLRDNVVVALGTDSAEGWNEALEPLGEEIDLKIVMRGDGYGPSDQTSFYAKQIPVLHFFTGTHEEYHAPEDDPSTINAEGAVKVVNLTARLGEELALGRTNPVYARATSAPAMQGDGRGYGSYLGTVPDFRSMSATEGGVLLSDVRPGGPADLAGIQSGDTIIAMAGTEIANLYDMTFALQDNKPGDTIDVVVIRKSEQLTLRATLGDRARRNETPQPSAEAASPHTQTPQPASPHGAMPTPDDDEEEAFELPEFYKNRPGSDFEISAGRPFETTNEKEVHITNVRQLTFGGENAEAYFSPDGRKLIYQATTEPGRCDQQYILDLATGETSMVSTGRGRTTCGYFDWPESDRIIYSSTEGGGDECPPPPDRSQGYVWATYKSYDIYQANLDGSNVKQLTNSPGYDAEATWCHRGGKIVFTSDRDGDLELYEMDEAGDTRRLTNAPGYDGGAFYSPDCKSIVWRASRPEGEALADYKSLLERGLIRPTSLELYVMDADGSNHTKLTNNGAANFGPYFHPDGKRIIYSSNADTGNVREFELFMVTTEGDEPQQITFSKGFDGFPQFSPDGEWLVFASNRANPQGRSTNLFIARWVD